MGPNVRQTQKNLWVASSDGDLGRVQYLIEQEGMSPNAPDPNTYTPMHAAASYGHIALLEYLVTKGGDVNVTDEDGDTPLYTVETLEVAKWLVDHGAIIDRVNSEGISPAEHLVEDYPAIARYLAPNLIPDTEAVDTEGGPSEYAQEQLTEVLTDKMMDKVQEIMERAQREGYDPEEELADLVRKTVLESLDAGAELVEGDIDAKDSLVQEESHAAKKQKTDEE